MESLPTVLAIDDDKISQKFIARALKDHYTLSAAYSGEEGLAQIDALAPNLILLDVEMPGLNGYEVCDRLRQNEKTRAIPVVFLSGGSSLREKMLGFEAGADDYIVKPFVPEVLLAKLSVLLRHRSQHTQLQKKVSQAEKTAYSALTGSSELGLAMNFVEQSHSVSNYEDLSLILFSITNRLDLNCSLLMQNDEEKYYFSSSGSINPLESEVITMLRKDQRFIDFGCRTQINFNQVALLIKNMPLNDMERYGRIKDLLPAMLSAADTKVQSLNTTTAIAKQTKELLESFQTIKTTLASLATSLHNNQVSSAKVMRTMLNELETNLPAMALETDQEEYIIKLIDASVEEALDITDASDKIGHSFNQMVSNFETLMEKQNQLVISLLTEKKPETKPITESCDMEVELF
ncbi:MAG: response regulator transcription factor [Gammaproteobacteria bacterium]|nr:response regulator transcription factor [Gammaproteobacteria bacterium]